MTKIKVKKIVKNRVKVIVAEKGKKIVIEGKERKKDIEMKEIRIEVEKSVEKAKEEWGGEKQLQWQQARDAALRRYCHEEKIRLLEIPYTDFDRIDEILEREL